MNPEYQAQAQKLEELRRAYASRNAVNGASGSTFVGPVTDLPVSHGTTTTYSNQQARPSDPLIYPGLYSPSGIDIMSILIRVYNRPNPTIHIGNVDGAVALVLADAEKPDLPLVYCSEAFEALTGYKSDEIMGHNCRFLQYSPGQAHQDIRVHEANALARKELREKIATGEEARVELLNYRKDGSLFANLLTIIPIDWGGDGQAKRRYIVGFQADGRSNF
ncbi:uncharacterized protein LY89DRAFT_688024 [Mollisia scopiformis]|uniref:PAS domain-containing protein n=1 Tax=Mollisia scopiformis TaxID=149040 RepID=A0A194WX70_MOLSC|nr:uncharacterized protein LY89DRAFT_688024 [Mollisia scopiformis]KUJ12274.1 hypothetical protein LY89DRAFT_688024 [Mollisia scopiformis]